MAPRTFWISSPTAAQWTKLQIPRDTVTLYVKNDGPYDVFLAFGGSAAPSYTPPNSLAPAVVFTGENEVVPIQSKGASPRELALNTIGDFDGNLWYYPVDNTSGLASSSRSVRNVVAVVAFGPYDPAPVQGSSRPLWYAQNRVIAIPPSSANSYMNEATFTASNQTDRPFPSAIGNVNGNTPAVVPIYLYSLHVVVITATACKFAIEAVWVDQFGATLQTDQIFRSQVGQSAPITFTPHFQHILRSGPPNGSTGVVVQFRAISISANPTTVDYNICIEADTTTGTNVPSIGGGLNSWSLSSGSVQF